MQIEKVTSMASNSNDFLKGKVAVVTGASSGIGIGIAQQLARAGVAVSLAARREEKLEQVKNTIEDEGGKAIAVKTDITNRQQVKDLIKKTEEQLGPVDILVNNAGVIVATYMKNLLEDEWDKMVDVNCKGMLNGVGAVLPAMIARKSGHIVNISSNSGRVPFPGIAVYTGTKFFVEGFSRSLRQEIKEHDVKVTTIQPGDVESSIWDVIPDPEPMELFKDIDKSKFMKAEDIGRAVVYAVSQPPGVAVNEVLIEPVAYPY